MKGLSPAVKLILGIYAKNEVTESLPAIDIVYTSLILFKFKASYKVFLTFLTLKSMYSFYIKCIFLITRMFSNFINLLSKVKTNKTVKIIRFEFNFIDKLSQWKQNLTKIIFLGLSQIKTLEFLPDYIEDTSFIICWADVTKAYWYKIVVDPSPTDNQTVKLVSKEGIKARNFSAQINNLDSGTNYKVSVYPENSFIFGTTGFPIVKEQTTSRKCFFNSKHGNVQF